MAAPSFHFLCQTALLALLSSSIFFKPILFRVDPTVVSSAATSIARLFAKDVVIRCQRPVVFPTLAIVSHVSMVGGAWSTDKQKLKTLAQMAAGDTTVGSRPI